MSSDDSTRPADQFLYESLAFFGAVTASVTHELNNVLGTIDQIAGLLEDLAATLTQREAITPEDLDSFALRITRQTERGTTLVKRLNAFAHSGDHEVTEFNLCDTIENLTALMRRLAQMQRVELALTLPPEDIIVKTNSFLLLQTVFHIIKSMLLHTEQNTAMTILLLERDDQAVVTIETQCVEALAEITDKDHIRLLATRLSGKIEEHTDAKRIRVVFSFPLVWS